MRQMVAIPTNQRNVVGVIKYIWQLQRFHVAVAKNNIAHPLAPLIWDSCDRWRESLQADAQLTQVPSALNPLRFALQDSQMRMRRILRTCNLQPSTRNLRRANRIQQTVRRALAVYRRWFTQPPARGIWVSKKCLFHRTARRRFRGAAALER